MPNFDKLKDQIEIKVTPEGLRIELLESAKGTFFDLGSPKPNQNGEELLDLLVGELGKLPNKISIEVIPIPSLIAGSGIIATGNFPPIAQIRRAA